MLLTIDALLISPFKISSPVSRRLASNTCTKAANCSTVSGRRREKSPGYSPSYWKVATVASVSGGCTESALVDATTHKRHCVVTYWTDCTRMAWTQCIGGLTDVLKTHWSVETNAKTDNFWGFKQFTERLACTAEEYGISVEVRSEAWTSQECPQCGSTDRHGIRTHSLVPMGSRDTPTLQHQRRS